MLNGNKVTGYQTIGPGTEITQIVPIKYKIALSIGPYKSVAWANAALPKVKALLNTLDLRVGNECRIGHTIDGGNMYITIELSEDRPDDGIETILAIKYLQYKDQILQ